ncbi:MAG: chemotaxis protein CheW [Acidobacteriota bacterium]|nr:chemotaxis protein CheW [Acidobacteriota bacterium]
MTQAAATAQSSFVILQVGERRLALPAAIVAELSPPVRMHSFPHDTPSILGVIVRRGHVVPVYDAASAIGIPAPSVQRFFLITRRRFGKSREFGAIPVNGDCELTVGEMHPPAADRPSCVAGMLPFGDELLDVFDLDALMTSSSPDIAEASEVRG